MPRNEKGVILVIVLLLIALLTSLGMSAMLMGGLDSALSGNYLRHKRGEAATDAGLDLAMATIFSRRTSIVPISVVPTYTNWSAVRRYSDSDMNISFKIKYKIKDNINYFNPVFGTTTTSFSQVVRYGQNYNFTQAPKVRGTQPVYTVTVTDNTTGEQSQSDIISSLGFKTPAALFVKGNVNVHKDGLATDEIICFFSSDPGTPALATTQAAGANVRIQHVTSKTSTGADNCSGTPTTPGRAIETNRRYTDDQGNTMYYYANGLAPSNTNPADMSKEIFLSDQVYTDAEITAEPNTTLKEAKQFIKFKSGTDFDQTHSNVIRYNYPWAAGTSIESLMGCTFSDLHDIADAEYTGNATWTGPDDSGGTLSYNGVLDCSNMALGTAANPQVTFINSDMNLNGTSNGHASLVMMSNPGTQMTGYGVLVINGNAKICGSINFHGLMIVRGNLNFRPWQGGNWCFQSGPDLKSTWDGFLILGGALDMQTLAGGTLILGYGSNTTGSTNDSIKAIIDAAIPHKVLSYRRVYK